jgi:hypothetical protein
VPSKGIRADKEVDQRRKPADENALTINGIGRNIVERLTAVAFIYNQQSASRTERRKGTTYQCRRLDRCPVLSLCLCGQMCERSIMITWVLTRFAAVAVAMNDVFRVDITVLLNDDVAVAAAGRRNVLP